VRRVVAAGLAPLLAISQLLVPVAVTAAVAAAGSVAVAVTRAAPVRASSQSVLILSTSVNGGLSSTEAAAVPAGDTVTVATPSVWDAMTTAQFAAYSAIVIGDPSSSSCAAGVPSDALSTAATWGAAVTGNVAVIGTAPAFAGVWGGPLLKDGIAYALAGSGTGLYVSLNCEYSAASAGTAVPLLAAVNGGGFTVTGQGSTCTNSGTVNTAEGRGVAQFNNLTGSALASWPSPACSVQETLNSWPAQFTGLGYDTAATPADFTASDGVAGQPYVLLSAPVSAATQALAPSAGGEVPAGTTTGGSNPAAPGVSQATAGDPVNTENGVFTQAATDLSVPGFGPSLGFTRTYDSGLAAQQTQAAAPGPLGYGWTDNWASSLAVSRPVPGDLYTLDGLGTSNGNGGPAVSAPLDSPQGVLSAGGNVYIADTDGQRVQEVAGSSGTQWGISMTAGDVYTIVGSPIGVSGTSGDGGAAGLALLSAPQGLAMDAAGNLFIADTGNNRIQEIAKASGTMSTVAGSASGSSGLSGDGGAAGSALLNSPGGITISAAGDRYIADTGNNRVQEIPAASGTQWGQAVTGGDMYTVAGSAAGTSGLSGDGGPASSALLKLPGGVALGSAGDLYIADTGNNRVQEAAKASGIISTFAGSATGSSGHTGDGGPAGSALLNGPAGVTVSGAGDVYVADTNSNRVQEVAKASGTQFGISMTAGDIYTIAGSASGSHGFSGDGSAAISALMHRAAAVTLDGSGDVFVADQSNNRVREVTVAGVISTFAGNGGQLSNDGNGGPATGAALKTPSGAVSDGAGNVYIADADNNRIQEIAAASHTQFGIAMTAGYVYTVAGSATAAGGSSGDGGAATAALLDRPSGVAVDAAGDIYIADTVNNRIQEVTAAGTMSTIAGSATGGSGLSGDGGPAGSALLNVPAGVAVDRAGDVYIADTGNNRIQEIAQASGTQFGIAMTAGDIYTIAGSATGISGLSGDGGPAASALLNAPQGAAADGSGNLYIADTGNNRVQEIAKAAGTQFGITMTTAGIYTIAGSATGSSGHSGDGGPATAALLDGPQSVTADGSGNLYIADTLNNRIQEIAAAGGTQWSAAMTAGDIYTVAGSATGASGDSGDGGPATAALIQNTTGIAVDPAGDLFLTNATNDRLREVTATSAGLFPEYPAPGGVTVTQDNGAQVTFYPQAGGTCTAPYVKAGGYCALPQDISATLTYNSGNQAYTFTPTPGTTYTYGWNGALTGQSDAAGDALTIAYSTPAPGTGQCPSTASTCQTITAASGRALVIGSNASGLVTSVTDPLGRRWTYAYTGSDLTSATDPMGRVTSYTYGPGSSGGPLQVNDLLSITSPNAQAGGPDVGHATVNVYNATGQVTSQTDSMGFTTTFDYSALNPSTGSGTVKVGDPDGNTTVYDYIQGALTAQSAWTGSTLVSEKDYGPDTTAGGTSGGTLLDTWTADGSGNITTSTYDSAGNTTSTTNPLGDQTTQTSTAMDNINCGSTAEASSACSSGPTPVPPGGVITPPSPAPPQGVTYTLYDTHGNALYTTTGVYQPGSSNASYLRTAYTLYNGNSVTLGGNSISCATASPSPSLPCATINADGVATQLGYDSAGDLTSSATPDGNGSEIAKTTYAYDGDGEPTSETSPDGNLSGANAGNYTTVTAYNAEGEQTSVTQAGGSGATATPRTTTNGYDASGNKTTVQDARGYTTTTAYNADDRPVLVTDPLGDATLTCYDSDGQTTEKVPPTGVAAGSLTAASCPASYPSGYGDRLAADATTFTFDANGNQTATTTPAPAGQTGYEKTISAYDSGGNLITVTSPPASDAQNAPGQVTRNSYNADGQLTSQTSGYGTSAASTVSYCYDPNEKQTSVIAPDGNVSGVASCETSYPWVVNASSYPGQAGYQTTSNYDSAGELVSTTAPATTTAPSGATTTYTYDAARNRLTSTDPDSVTTTWTFTPANLKATVSYSGSSAHSVSYSYDANGQPTGMTDATGSSSYGYDPFGELTSATNGAGRTVGYGYDADGNPTGVTYPLPASAAWVTSDTVSYGYDHADNLNSITDFNGRQITVGDTADGLAASLTLGSTGDTITTSFGQADMPSLIALKNASSTLQSFSYSDAPSSDILTEADTPSAPTTPATYTYDAIGRVASMTPGSGSTLSYGFDTSGNLVTLPAGATGTYDGIGELTSSVLSGTTTSYAYNADGQRLTAKDGSTTIASGTWNGASQLSAYTDSAAAMSTASYDGHGLRASATTTPVGGSASTQDFTWDTVMKSAPVLLMDSTNAYIYGPSSAPAEQVNLSTGAVTYLVSDLLGSVRGIVSSSGTLTATTAYDAWGNTETPGGLTAATPFGYAGGYTDVTGLIYLINRYYDPATGQFTSRDPAVSQTQQPYGYASGDPVRVIDPTGMASVHPGGWAVDGYGCAKSRWGFTTWCKLILKILIGDSLGNLADRINVEITVNPGARRSRINYWAFYSPDGGHFSQVHINGYTLCYRNRGLCWDDLIPINPRSSGHFYLDSQVPLNGDKISHAFTLSGYCAVCTGRKYTTDSFRTGMATCNKNNNNCYY
jgi:RHS repeat-associated protein